MLLGDQKCSYESDCDTNRRNRGDNRHDIAICPEKPFARTAAVAKADQSIGWNRRHRVPHCGSAAMSRIAVTPACPRPLCAVAHQYEWRPDRRMCFDAATSDQGPN